MDAACSHLRILNGAGMYCMNEKLSIFSVLMLVILRNQLYLFIVLFYCVCELLLENADEMFNISTCNHLECNLENFCANINIGTTVSLALKQAKFTSTKHAGAPSPGPRGLPHVPRVMHSLCPAQ